MKKLIAILILSAACSYSSAQNYLMSNTNVSTCGSTHFMMEEEQDQIIATIRM